MRAVPAAPKRLACERGQTTAAHRILIAVIAPAAVVVAITVGSNTPPPVDGGGTFKRSPRSDLRLRRLRCDLTNPVLL
jgi:hypothetical protein